MTCFPDTVSAIDWTAVGAIATAVGASATTIAIGLAIISYRGQTRASEVDNCLEMVNQLSEAQRRLRSANKGDDKKFELLELSNLLELFALLTNRRTISGSTKILITNLLIETLAYIRRTKELQDFLDSAISSDTTFCELMKFNSDYDTEIQEVVRRAEEKELASLG